MTMRRALLILVGLYVLAAVVTSAAEAAGVVRKCGCPSDCWCKRPGLRLFRWVAPIGHRSIGPDAKQGMAHP